VIHAFSGADGMKPEAPSINVDGTFYGTAYLGGDPNCDCGTVFKITP